ncbi:MAG: aldo/keto reductase [Aminipila sp.]
MGNTTFDLNKRTVMLNSGYEMPILGIGTYLLSDKQAEDSVYTALNYGYRLIDTARIYGNERGVGKGIKKSGVLREEIFLTTKLWTADFNFAAKAIDISLEKLDVEYIDLLLLHHTASYDEEAYKAMENAVKAGKVRSIGISNFYEKDYDRIMKMATITPAVVQNETHPYYQENGVKKHIKLYGTVMESWFPVGGKGTTHILFNDKTIAEIAEAHDKTSAQVLLRWHLQVGNVAIPGSSSKKHIKEDIEIFDFELTEDEMTRIAALDQGRRFATY